MAVAFDWEFLRFAVKRQRLNVSHRMPAQVERQENHRRGRVLIDGRLAQRTWRTPVDQAAALSGLTAAAVNGAPVAVDQFRRAARTTADNQVVGCDCSRRDSAVVVATDIEERQCHVDYRGEAVVHWASRATRHVYGWDTANAVVFLAIGACGDTAATQPVRQLWASLGRQKPQPPQRNGPWLLSPIAVSRLCTAPIQQVLMQGTGSTSCLPPATRVRDTGDGPVVDLDGTPRRPLLLMDSDSITTPIRQLADGSAPADWTGHAGLQGLHFESLSIEAAEAPASDDLPSGCPVVTDARTVSGSSNALILNMLTARTDQSQVVVLQDLATLVRAGQWVGPPSLGLGGWMSRWLYLAPDTITGQVLEVA